MMDIVIKAWSELVLGSQNLVNEFMGKDSTPHVLTDGKFGTSIDFMLAVDLGYLAIVAFSLLFLKKAPPDPERVPLTPKKKEKGLIDHFKLFHNGFLFALSSYMCLEALRQALLNEFSLFGNGMAKGTEPHAQGLANIVWIFYLSKSYEFVDTLIMIYTEKWKQVSFLHVYHHSTIFAIWWIIAKYAPGGDAYFSVILNSFVHVVMYAYYFFTSINLNFIRVVKPYITALQMTQFVCMLIQSVYDYLTPYDYPQSLVVLLGIYMVTLLILFGNFFLQSYCKKPKKKRT
jgi:hypothetical protein